MVEETAEEKLSLLLPATNATICPECGRSELRRSSPLTMLLNGIEIEIWRRRIMFKPATALRGSGKGTERVLRLISQLERVIRKYSSI